MDINIEELRALSDEQKKIFLQKYVGKDRKKMKNLLYGNQPILSNELKELTEIFNSTSDPATRFETLYAETTKHFEEMENPFVEFLTFYRKMIDVHVASLATLAGDTLKAFGEWLETKENKTELFEKYCTPEFKTEVLRTMTAHHTVHLTLAEEIFHLEKTEITGMIRARIKKYRNAGKYKEAMALSEQFKMNKTWTFEAYLLPRLLQDSNGYESVKDHCKGNKKLETALIEFLDSLVFADDGKILRTAVEKFEPYLSLKVAEEFLTPASCKRRVKNLLAFYGREGEMDTLAPQYAWKIREAEVTYAMKQRFLDKNPLSHESYVSKVKKLLEKTGESRKIYLVNLIWNKREIGVDDRRRDAIAWSFIYRLDPRDLPQSMQTFMADNQWLVDEIKEEVLAKKSTKTLDNLRLNGKNIIFVEDLNSLNSLAEKLLKEEIIGFDSETVPDLILKSKLALLQISISDGIYLVDFYKFITENIFTDEIKDDFLKAFLLSDGLKLGFDIINDLRLLPIEDKLQYNNCLCLKRFIETILEEDPDFIDLSEGDGKVSIKLSTICEKVLGKEIDKTQQQSDWALRPLEEAQMFYAAQDADILLKLYEKIKEMALSRGLNFSDLVEKSMGDITKPSKNKEIKKKMDSMKWEEYVKLFSTASSSRKPTETCIGLDLMLLGLAKPLRRCGIDAFVPKEHMDLVKKARKCPKMMLVTSGKAFERLNNDFRGRVIYVDPQDNAIQQMAVVLKKLRVRLDPEEAFTRCRECNQLGFIVLPAPVIQALHYSAVTVRQLYFTGTYDSAPWRQMLATVNPEEFDGYGCQVDAHEEYFHVNVYRGRVDIIRNLYFYQDGDEWRKTEINAAETDDSKSEIIGGKTQDQWGKLDGNLPAEELKILGDESATAGKAEQLQRSVDLRKKRAKSQKLSDFPFV